MYKIILTVCIFFLSQLAFAQQIIFGTNNYVEYHVGTLPFVISVPHGGSLVPGSIPDRTCNNPVFAKDGLTIETALEIKNYLYQITGCYPHLIISNLRRTKLDPNRNIADAACGNSEAETAWNEFHNFITTARNAANQAYNFKTFFVDLHGHGNPIERIELGYLLYDDELELPDATLNTAQYINYSSIKNLANSNKNNYTHAQMLKGSKSFGTMLVDKGYQAVPSQDIPFPGTTTNYYSGGYITANHTCYSSGAPINGLQMELNYSGVIDTPPNRVLFAKAFSEVLFDYLNTHFDMNWNACQPLSAEKELKESGEVYLYPNPALKGDFVCLNHLGEGVYFYQVLNALGQELKSGEISSDNNRINTEILHSGIYFLHLSQPEKQQRVLLKLLLNE